MDDPDNSGHLDIFSKSYRAKGLPGGAMGIRKSECLQPTERHSSGFEAKKANQYKSFGNYNELHSNALKKRLWENFNEVREEPTAQKLERIQTSRDAINR